MLNIVLLKIIDIEIVRKETINWDIFEIYTYTYLGLTIYHGYKLQ